jgi:hypothetical protein
MKDNKPKLDLDQNPNQIEDLKFEVVSLMRYWLV